MITTITYLAAALLGSAMVLGTLGLLLLAAWLSVEAVRGVLTYLGMWREAVLFVQERYRIRKVTERRDLPPCRPACAHERVRLRERIIELEGRS